MAWIDDRIWCHPKIAGLTHKAFRSYVSSICYSSGFQLGGVLERSHQATLGADAKVRAELVAAGLWDDMGQGVIAIHDWHEHNGKRDARKKADRDRKRQERDNDPDSWVIRSGRWIHTRRAVYERDRGVCVDCGAEAESWHADHNPDRKTLRERGLDPFDLQFIETRCPRCHGQRHIKERTAAWTDKRQNKRQTKGQRADRRALTSEGSEEEPRAVNALRPAARDEQPNGPGEDTDELHPLVAAIAPPLGDVP